MSLASAPKREDDQIPPASTTTDPPEDPKLLPHDAIMQILARLPTEHLLPFSRVSKLWMRTIRQPFFRSLHSGCRSREPDPPSPYVLLRDNKPDPKFVLVSPSDVRRGRPSRVLPLDNLVFHDRKAYSNTCNGLICLSPKVIDQHPMLVWNPLTGEYDALPIVDPHVRERRIPSMMMSATVSSMDPVTGEMRVVKEFNPLTGKDITAPLPDDEQLYLLQCCGLGLSPSTNEYKVVRVSCGLVGWDRHHPQKIEVYTMGGDGSWRTVLRVDTDRCCHTEPLYAEGKLFWTACTHGEAPDIMCFDLTTEELTAATPAGLPEHIHYCRLVWLGRRIAVIDVREVERDDAISVWVLDGASSCRFSWTERCEFSVCRRTRLEDPIHVWECNGGGVLVFWFLRFVVYYEERDGRHWVKSVPDMGGYAGKRCVGYRPSLMAPDGRFGGCKITDGFAAKGF